MPRGIVVMVHVLRDRAHLDGLERADIADQLVPVPADPFVATSTLVQRVPQPELLLAV